MSVSSSFVHEIEQHIASGTVQLPVFSPTAMRVQQELVRQEPDMGKVEKLIIQDQALAGEVLKTANSAYYKGLVEVKTVRAAIVRLGVKEVGRIVLLASSKKLFTSTDAEITQMVKKLWQHSAGCALAAHWLATRCKYGALAGEAFFAGLLHDMGKLLILTIIEQKKMRSSERMNQSLLMELIFTLHTQKGYALMEHWNIPELYRLVARDHHLSEVDTKNTLLLLVRLADMACNKLGIGIHTTPDLNLAASSEADLLEVSEIDLAQLEIMLEDTKGLIG